MASDQERRVASLNASYLRWNSGNCYTHYARLTTLTSLVLSNCELKAFPSLPPLPNLEELDISCNMIHKLDSDLNSSRLKKLDLSANAFHTFADLKGLENFTVIEELDLRFNTVCLRKGYRAKVTSDAPTLNVLDGIPVDPNDKVSDSNVYR
jgi:Leucine-rich repeat (LRR) protein